MVETIYICDRCGKRYKNSNKPEKYIICLPADGEKRFYPHPIDLCPECLEDLRYFMEDALMEQI